MYIYRERDRDKNYFVSQELTYYSFRQGASGGVMVSKLD